MNKLEEYAKEKSLSDDWWIAEKDNMETSFCKGFDAAIALDLPVKFAKWKETSTKKNNDESYTIFQYHLTHLPDLPALYKWYLDNIFKIE